MSINTMLKYIKKNSSSANSKYSTESFSDFNDFSFSEETAVALINIQKDNSYSFEHWDNIVREKINESILMSHMALEPIRERNNQKAMIRDLRSKKFSTEDCNKIIEIMSMEGIGEFAKNIGKRAIAVIEKIIEALAGFKRMIGRIIRSPWTKPQSKLFVDYSSKMSEILSKVPTTEKRSLKPYSISFKNIDERIKEIIDAANKLESKAASLDGSNIPTPSSIKEIFAFADSSVKNDDDSATSLVNKWFFGQTKVPKNQEIEIKKVLENDAFQACSNKFLNALNRINEGADRLMRCCGKLIKAIKNSDTLDKDATDAQKEEQKKRREALTEIQSKAIFAQSVMRAMFNCSLAYRTNVYKAAKAAIALVEKKPKEKK